MQRFRWQGLADVEPPSTGPDLWKIAKWTGVVWVAIWILAGITPPLPKLHHRARPREW